MEMGAGEDGAGMWNLKETVSRARKGLRRQRQNVSTLNKLKSGVLAFVKAPSCTGKGDTMHCFHLLVSKVCIVYQKSKPYEVNTFP